MSDQGAPLSTGLPELDEVFREVRPGDNIVWRIDSIEDYADFVRPLAAFAKEHDRKLIYFRFAEHPALFTEQDGVETHKLSPEKRFGPFIDDIHTIISTARNGTLYVFDCLSELAADWCSDRMLGNFFSLTCPFLYIHAGLAYFSFLRNYHCPHAEEPITNTTQMLVDVYRYCNKLYIHPIKVKDRHSPTMYMLHVHEDKKFVPVTQSCLITEVLAHVPWSRTDAASYMRGYWSKVFNRAGLLEREFERGNASKEEIDKLLRKLVRMAISHDEKILELAERYFSLYDLLKIRSRMIGTGLIGGKSVGMLLARAILRADDPSWADILETHDSFYVGSDVFYTYLVQNGYWWMLKRNSSATAPNSSLETVRQQMLTGEFPDYIIKQFADMLDYFGQSPIIVRSSSLLEDRFESAFAGKYESVFCANQGDRQKRLEEFLFAVCTVYASMVSPEAIAYRAQRGLLYKDEQMALLIQRVSGSTHGGYFYPQAAGVGFSFNPYVWHKSIDPKAGMLRLVFGMGTRAVERSDDDYTRITALNAPLRRPEPTLAQVRQYAQRKVDVLDLHSNELISISFEEIAKSKPDLPLEMFASRDHALERQLPPKQRNSVFSHVLTFDTLLSKTDFVDKMAKALSTLEKAYACPVDVEFTVNFFDPEHYKLNLVQCRPLQITSTGESVPPPPNISKENLLLKTTGPVIGKGVATPLDWVIYVAPSVFGSVPVPERSIVARIIGELMRDPKIQSKRTLLIGPGRWGTTTPELGVPVTFPEINSALAVCEVVTMHNNLIPDVSLGTHFFNELVENDMLYLALFPERDGNFVNEKFFEQALPNRLTDFLPYETEWENTVRLLSVSDLPEDTTLWLNGDTLEQQVVCYLEK